MSGESRPENASRFYQPIMDWMRTLEDYLSKNNMPFEFDFKFDYFNSTSAKYILDICKKLGKLHSNDMQIVVRWHYEEDDEDMLQVGKEMSRMSKFPFEYIEISF